MSNKICISTAYSVNRLKNCKKVFDEIKSLGFSFVELNVDIPEDWMPRIKQIKNDYNIEAAGLHNFCPRIKDIPNGRHYLKPYLLTSDDEEERGMAVKYTKKTIDYAAELGAVYVVLHLGEVHTEASGAGIYEFALENGIGNSAFERIKSECLQERKNKYSKYLDMGYRSLEELLKHAEKSNIKLGLENRMYLNEIPDYEEAGIIIDKFKSEYLGFWYDTGHAEIIYRMGAVASPVDYLKSYSGSLLGMHLHDVVGIVDHYAVGAGEIDFSRIKAFVGDNTVLTMEVHRKSGVDAVKKGLEIVNNFCAH